MKWVLCAAAVLAFAGAGSAEEGGGIGWEETFDSAAAVERIAIVRIQCENRAEWPDVAEAKVEDGELVVRSNWPRANARAFAIYGWGKGVYHDTSGFAPFAPVDLVKHPIIELRWKGIRSALWWYFGVVYETLEGKVSHDSFSPRQNSTGEWVIERFRCNEDGAHPQKSTPVKLLGVSIMQQDNERDSAIAFDYIRVRGFTEEEAKGEAARAERLKRYRLPAAPAWMGRTFTYGPWTSAYINPTVGDFAWGGIEGFYGDLVRHHMNFLCRDARDAYEDVYFEATGKAIQGRWDQRMKEIALDDGAADLFIERTKEHCAAARDAGLMLGRDVDFLARRFNENGLEATERMVKRLAAGLAGVEGLAAWVHDDEPTADRLWPFVAIKQMFEENDAGRLVVSSFNLPSRAAVYEPYVTVVQPDHYPIRKDNGRDAWEVRRVLRAYRQTVDRPLWFIGQAFGLRREDEGLPVRMRLCPTRAEFRLMYHLAIAEGVKGITFFVPSGNVSEHMFDRLGTPAPFMEDAKVLGGRLASFGPLLLGCEVEEDAGVSVRTEKAGWMGDTGHGLSAAVLRGREREVRCVIVVNESVQEERRGEVTLADWGGAVVMDADTLERLRPAGANRYAVERLAPGDARFLVAGAADEVEKVRAEIVGNREREAARVMKPDLLIARRWGMDLGEVEAALAGGRIREAQAALAGALAGDQTYDACRWELAVMRPDFARAVDEVYMERWNSPRKGREGFVESLETFATRHSALRARLIQAQGRDTLPADIAACREELGRILSELGLPE
ncbi:MAG: hypothetical protein V2A58_10880 [Planctomycetota bacterium]